MRLMIILLFAAPVLLATPPNSEGQAFLSSQRFMANHLVKKKWGATRLNLEQFKKGNSKVRGTMVFSLLSDKTLIGKSADEIRTLLGPFTGFFWSDSIPAYMIDEGWQHKKDSWQLVFLLDEQGRVNDIRVHKNCCE